MWLVYSVMKIKYFDLKREYPIKCKAFLPDNDGIKMFILGVHGFAGDKESSMLFELAKAVVPEGGAVICFDFPAHGDSPTDESKLTVENCKSDLLAVAKWAENACPIAEKFVLATSFGGYISLLASDSLVGYKMVLRVPAVTMPKVLLEAVLNVTANQFKEAGVIECGFERKIRIPYSFYEDLVCYDPYDKNYDTPILVIHGNKDDVVPIDDVVRFCDNRKNTSLVVINNADHRFKKEGEIERVVCTAARFMKIANE